MNPFSRTEALLGAEGMARLRSARVAVFGIGGVGGHAAEALARSGVGALELFDSDVVCESNLNRQIIAAHSTLGMPKVDAMVWRLKDITPETEVVPHRLFYMPDTADEVDLRGFDYIVDAVDTVTAKLELAVRAQALGIPIISAMGAGNKLDPTKLTVSDIFKTSADPLARVMRRELRKRGVRHLKTVWSTEPPVPFRGETPSEDSPRRSIPGSTAFVPSAMGLIIAAEIVRELARPEG